MPQLKCKPGDLCRILSGPHKDHFITVTQLDPMSDPDLGLAWEYEGPKYDSDPGYIQWSFFDRILQPLANPKDDEQDLMLAPLPFDIARHELEMITGDITA